jgi:hypothetical protein
VRNAVHFTGKKCKQNFNGETSCETTTKKSKRIHKYNKMDLREKILGRNEVDGS